MAVVEMSKLSLIAMSYDRDKILNALQKTQTTEVKLHSETENTAVLEADTETLCAELNSVEMVLEVLLSRLESYNKEHKIKEDTTAEVEVSYSEFMSAKDKAASVRALVSEVNSLLDSERELTAELTRIRREMATAKVYSHFTSPLKPCKTAYTTVKVGTIPAASSDAFVRAADSVPLMAYKILPGSADSALVVVASHKSAEEAAYDLLQSFGFTNCPFDDERTGEQLYASLEAQEEALVSQIADIKGKFISYDKSIRDLKIYCDYLGFEIEKGQLSEKLRATEATFLLEAYVPKEAQDIVKQALAETSDAVWYEFTQPTEDETPPTLLKNHKIFSNFESITNTYSPVNYREFDPNTIMAIFYSIFMGFIMGDIGYGLLMTGVGAYLCLHSKRETGLTKLAGVFAVGGIFAIMWGFLFNSMFGISFKFLDPYYDPKELNAYGKPVIHGVIPDAMAGRYSLMGIQVPSVLIIAMLVGAVQLCAGYVCKAVQCWRRGQIFDGIFDGMTWAFFMVGLELAIVGFIDEFHLSILATVGGIIAGASLAVAMLTAGRKEKFIGKFTKGFGAAYGIINIISDILSYARLYGLMLSGAVIAQIISGFVVTGYNGSTPFIFSGNVFLIVLGVLLMVVGHIFNLAIGLLGAYIHDARLQYVEFYGRFFEGDGEIFTPLGSQQKYIYINR